MNIIVSKDIVKLNENHSENHYGEYNVNECVFEFDEYFDSVPIKKAIFTSQSNNKSFEIDIINNKCTVPHEVLTKVYDTVILGVYGYDVNEETLLVRYSPEPTTFVVNEGSYKEGAEQPEIITPTQYDMFSKALQEGLTEVDKRLDDVEKQGDYASEQGNYAKEQGDYAKEQGTNAKNIAEETEKKAEEGKFNGKSLEFVWQGTKLGVRLEGQEAYQFVDLQGVQGEIGATGEPFKIKKTYASVSEMNADFRNMTFGDYVMIASSVEVEDNAKLYTRGESAWIFISDFSGAMGIRGETGLTPNIKIGEVKTLEAGSQAKVTRSGSNEEPVFNFELPKGDKGDNYVLTEEDKVEIGEKVNTEYEKRIEQNEKYISELEATIDILTNTNKAKGELVHITDALGLPTFETTANGNVEQETTRGVNILNWNRSGSETSNGITRTYITPTEINFKGKVENKSNAIFGISLGTLEAGTYTISFTNHDSTKLHYLISNVGNISSNYKTFTLSEIGDRYLQVFCDTEDTIDITIKFQLEKGNTATEWEKYTGGQASPNPEFPSEIEVLEGYNLFDKNNANVIDGYISGSSATKIEASYYGKTIYIKCEPNTSYSISKLANRFFMASSSEIPQIGTNIENVVNGGDTSIEYNNYVTSANAKYLVFYCYYSQNASITFEEMLDSIQIVKGKETKTYLPYGCVGYKNVGKNKLNVKPYTHTSYGITTNFDGKKFKIKGTTTQHWLFLSKEFPLYLKLGKYTLSKYKTTSFQLVLNLWNGEKQIQSVYLNQTKTTISFEVKEKITKATLSIDNIKTGDVFDEEIEIQLEPGEVSTKFEIPQEQIVYLDLKGNFVGKLSDSIKDYLVTDKKKYWLVKNVEKGILSFKRIWVGDKFKFAFFDKPTNQLGYEEYLRVPIMSEASINTTSDIEFAITSSGNQLENALLLSLDNPMTIEELKALADGKPFYYPTKKTEIIELGTLEEPIKTFEGVNNIQLLANIPTEIEVKYALDVKKYYDNKLAEISAQII